MGWSFLVTGIILWLAESYKKWGHKKIEEITFIDTIVVGILQGVAILPGISRSGMTICGSLFRKIDKAVAARFSFLLSIPAILGAVVVQIPDLLDGGAEVIGVGPLVVGTLVAAVVGYIAIKWMLRIVQRGSLKIFSVYVWILGASIIIAQLCGVF